jgi:hypothetical protein
MNKSEIAEKAALEIAKLATGWDYSDVPDLFEEEILKFVERAIAESLARRRRDLALQVLKQ